MNIKSIMKVRSNYIKTKKISELIVQKSGLDTVILRPIIVIGKYDYNNYSRIFQMLYEGSLKVAWPGKLAFCCASEVARAHLMAYKMGTRNEIYYLGGEWTTWYDYIQRASKLMNISSPRKPYALWIYYVIAYFMLLRQRLTRKEALITPELVDLIANAKSDIPSTEKIKTLIHLKYQYIPLDKSLLEAYNWWKILFFSENIDQTGDHKD
jgi:dihydroflavonol-4-reductase